MGMIILESNPKSHKERGRVEQRIRVICDTLIKVGTLEHTSMTALQWETLFSKVVNTLVLSINPIHSIQNLNVVFVVLDSYQVVLDPGR